MNLGAASASHTWVLAVTGGVVTQSLVTKLPWSKTSTDNDDDAYDGDTGDYDAYNSQLLCPGGATGNRLPMTRSPHDVTTHDDIFVSPHRFAHAAATLLSEIYFEQARILSFK